MQTAQDQPEHYKTSTCKQHRTRERTTRHPDTNRTGPASALQDNHMQTAQDQPAYYKTTTCKLQSSFAPADALQNNHMQTPASALQEKPHANNTGPAIALQDNHKQTAQDTPSHYETTTCKQHRNRHRTTRQPHAYSTDQANALLEAITQRHCGLIC
ncbi:hypothetical protein ACJMK2_003904 [Sinanodonta woodiana]|uniref:Uncharacterized protein n=1 Tax=Sinanodonta woodiana TaxID=1069815 RepID=A0ABD3Y2G1_SINWO